MTLVDFWAPWCGPCQMQLPILEQVAQGLGSRATVAKMNVDEAQNIPMMLGIRSIPTLMIFKNGKMEERMVGVQNSATLVAKLEKHLQP